MPIKLREDGGVEEQEEEVEGREAAESTRGKKWGTKKFVALGFLVVLVGIGAWTALRSGGGFLTNSNAYQAVFLDNNQVYFGKLADMASAYPVLTDIYYLRVTQPLQPPQGGTAQPDINLVKLGTELHGPSDEMKINKEHILFVEDLKPDSEVTKAINSFKEAQKK